MVCGEMAAPEGAVRLDSGSKDTDKRRAELSESYDLLDTLSHLLRRTHFFAEKLFAEILGAHGVTSRQLALLVAVLHHPGASQKEIGRLIALDTNTISDLVRRMVDKDLLEKRVSEADGRSFAIELTGKGTATLRAIVADNGLYQSAIVENLSDSERSELKRLLRKILGL